MSISSRRLAAGPARPGSEPRASRVSPAGAAALSFLFPGLGQLAAGRRDRGLIVAIPALSLLASVGLVLLFARHSIITGFASQAGLQSLLLLDVVTFAYRVWAILDAYLVAGGSVATLVRPRGTAAAASLATIVVLIGSSMWIHGYVAASDASIQQSLSSIFNSNGPSWLAANANATVPPDYTMAPIAADQAVASPPPAGSSAGSSAGAGTPAGPSGSPAPVVYALGDLPASSNTSGSCGSDGYLNVLLIGADQGPGGGRMSGLRPDSMIALQVKLATGQAAMYGIPRNMINIPLPAESAKFYACHCFGPAPGSNQAPANYLVDYLWQEAAITHPQFYSQYGTGNTWSAAYIRGVDALEGAVGALLGVHMDGAVVINLPGFVTLINTIAPQGVAVNVPYEVKEYPKGTRDYTGALIPGYEPANGGNDIWGIDIKPGTQVMNGDTLLEFARIRHVIGHDSDYYRMQRQQIALKAVRAQLDPCSLVPRIPSVMSALAGALWTDLPIDALPQFAALAEHVGVGSIASYGLDPSTTGAVDDILTVASVDKIQSIVAGGLASVPGGIGGSGGGGGGLSC